MREKVCAIFGGKLKNLSIEHMRGAGERARERDLGTGSGNGKVNWELGTWRGEAPFVGARCLCLNYWPNGIKFSSIY